MILSSSSLTTSSSTQKTEQEHEKHLYGVLDNFREAKLYAKKSKCSFFTDKVAYLGFIVSREGLSLDPEKVEAIFKWPIPKNVTEVRSFMGQQAQGDSCLLSRSQVARF